MLVLDLPDQRNRPRISHEKAVNGLHLSIGAIKPREQPS
jgi:hypothetical protein